MSLSRKPLLRQCTPVKIIANSTGSGYSGNVEHADTYIMEIAILMDLFHNVYLYCSGVHIVIGIFHLPIATPLPRVLATWYQRRFKL